MAPQDKIVTRVYITREKVRRDMEICEGGGGRGAREGGGLIELSFTCDQVL